MNTIVFTGKLIADVRINKGEKGNFMSFTLFETGKGENMPKLECTQSFKGEDAPKIAEWLKKFATVAVSGTPYAKLGKDKDGNAVAVQAAFVDKIDICAFSPKTETQE